MAGPINASWSLRSPYSYLAKADLVQLHHDVDIHPRVVLPIAIRDKATLFDASNREPS